MSALKRCRPMLGTFVEIAVHDESADAMRLAAIGAGFDAVARVQVLMSFHDAQSELSRLNAAEAGDVVELDRWTVEVLALGQDLQRATGGHFDAGVGATLVHRGMLPHHGRPKRPLSSIMDLDVVDALHVRVRRPVCIDLGGIAKGFAVDKAVEALSACGVRRAVVNAGGDLRVLGDAPQPIHVRRAHDPATPVHVGDLADGAMATSGAYFPGAGVSAASCLGALIDPRTHSAVGAGRSFTVLAPSCAVADGLTKALAVAGRIAPACLLHYGAEAIDA